MADFFTIGTTAAEVPANTAEHKKITNVGGGTLYYKTTSDVSSTSNDGNLTIGQTVTVTTSNWIVGTTASLKVLVEPVAAATYTDVTVSDDLTVGDDLTVTDDLDADAVTATSVSVDGAAGLVATADGGKNTLHLSDGTANVGITIGTTNPVELFRSGADALTITDATTVTGGVTSTGTLAATNAATVGTTLGVTGATTVTGGIVQATAPHGFSNWQPAAATSGTDTTPADGTHFLTSIFVPVNKTITGVGYLIGSVGGTDKVYAALYDADGAALGNSSVAAGGATVGTAAEVQTLALTSTYAAKGPRLYYVGISMNGNTARLRTVPAFCQAGLYAGSVAQTHGTVATVVEPVTFTADKAPVVYLY